LREAPRVLKLLENFVQVQRLVLELLNGIAHLLLEGLLYVSSCASSGD
jgi:hypothetical protein